MTPDDRRLLAENAIVALDPVSVGLFAQVRRVASAEGPVMVRGEPGAGKGVVAWLLHRLGPRREEPLHTIDCARLTRYTPDAPPVELRGGLTDHDTAADPRGWALPSNGTLLLDEVGELSAEWQALMLHFLKGREREGSLPRRGSLPPRIVCTSRRDLVADIKSGRFRADLYYRFNAIQVEVPPLRDRPDDIMPTAWNAVSTQRPRITMDSDFGLSLLRHTWPGNFRELINTVRVACTICEDDRLRGVHFFLAHRQCSVAAQAAEGARGAPREDRYARREALIVALERQAGDPRQTAVALGISRQELMRQVRLYKLQRLVARAPR